jgi:hypothetical protein
MPLAAMMMKLNQHLTAEAIQNGIAQDPGVLDRLRHHDSLVDLATELGQLDEDEAKYLADIPPSLRQGIGAAVAHAASEGRAVHVHYSPGYDFSVQLWDHVTGLSVHVSGPYPPDYPRKSYQQPKA